MTVEVRRSGDRKLLIRAGAFCTSATAPEWQSSIGLIATLSELPEYQDRDQMRRQLT